VNRWARPATGRDGVLGALREALRRTHACARALSVRMSPTRCDREMPKRGRSVVRRPLSPTGGATTGAAVLTGVCDRELAGSAVEWLTTSLSAAHLAELVLTAEISPPGARKRRSGFAPDQVWREAVARSGVKGGWALIRATLLTMDVEAPAWPVEELARPGAVARGDAVVAWAQHALDIPTMRSLAHAVTRTPLGRARANAAETATAMWAALCTGRSPDEAWARLCEHLPEEAQPPRWIALRRSGGAGSGGGQRERERGGGGGGGDGAGLSEGGGRNDSEDDGTR
jgi:hypothetical protein